MAKYGQGKYKTFKYGRYGALAKAIGKSVVYRINGVINQSFKIEGLQASIFRIRSNTSNFVVSQTEVITGQYSKIRIRSNTSQWLVSEQAILEEIQDGKIT